MCFVTSAWQFCKSHISSLISLLLYGILENPPEKVPHDSSTKVPRNFRGTFAGFCVTPSCSTGKPWKSWFFHRNTFASYGETLDFVYFFCDVSANLTSNRGFHESSTKLSWNFRAAFFPQKNLWMASTCDEINENFNFSWIVEKLRQNTGFS